MEPQEYLHVYAEKMEVKIYQEQYRMANILFESMKLSGVVQVSQGPPGMGKTIVVLCTAKALNDLEKRVLVVAPTYNHILNNMEREAKIIYLDEIPIQYGLTNDRYKDQHANCPRENPFCNQDPLSDGCQQCDCIIAQDWKKCKESQLVFTVHAVIASKPSYMNKFDVVLIDESHGLPNVIRSQTQDTLKREKLEKLILEEQDEQIKQELQNVIDISVQIKKRSTNPSSIPPILYEQIGESLKKAAIKANPNSDLYGYRYLDKVKMLSGGNLSLQNYSRKINLNDNISIGLISATIEDPQGHVKDCLFDSLTLRPVDSYRNSSYFMRRFEKRPILGLIDGPRLAKNDPQNYKIPRSEANRILVQLVQNISEVTLILCQNMTDAKSIQEEMQKIDTIKNRLEILPEGKDIDDLDTYEAIILRRLEKGKNIIIATASSKLWEGANIPQLHFLIVDSLPYRQMDEDEKNATGSKRAKTWKSMKRFMLDKIQQGIGRLVRSDEDWGVAVILDGRFYSNRNQFFKDLPDYITSDQIFRWIDKKNLEGEAIKLLNKLRQGKDTRKNKDLKEFMK